MADTSVYISDFKGKVDFSNLKDPIVDIDSAVFDGLSDKFKNITLKDATISRRGFEVNIYAKIDDIKLYEEDSKRIDLRFEDSKTPVLHLSIGIGGMNIGLSDFQAGLVFTNLLNNSVIDLKSLVQNDMEVPKCL